jgi:uncharacterized membrane protein
MYKMPFAARSIPIVAASRKISTSPSSSSESLPSDNFELSSTYLYVAIGAIILYLFYLYNKSRNENKTMYSFKNVNGRKKQNNYVFRYRKL